MDSQRVNVSRTTVSEIPHAGVTSLGASYTHVKSLKGVIGTDTKSIVMYHAFLESLEGFEDTTSVDKAYLGFNRIYGFSPKDKEIPKIKVLDLVGNPITSLENCPPCDELIVSATLIKNLIGAPEGIRIIRCGHSTHLESLEGCPSTVEIIECSCSPNLVIREEHKPKNLKELLKERV
jgi:hypothetical protein